jgi:hypothetical protein
MHTTPVNAVVFFHLQKVYGNQYMRIYQGADGAVLCCPKARPAVSNVRVFLSVANTLRFESTEPQVEPFLGVGSPTR